MAYRDILEIPERIKNSEIKKDFKERPHHIASATNKNYVPRHSVVQVPLHPSIPNLAKISKKKISKKKISKKWSTLNTITRGITPISPRKSRQRSKRSFQSQEEQSETKSDDTN